MEDRQRDDLVVVLREPHAAPAGRVAALESADLVAGEADRLALPRREQDIVILVQQRDADQPVVLVLALELHRDLAVRRHVGEGVHAVAAHAALRGREHDRSEEHTSELQSLMRISYAVFCLKKKKYNHST